MKRTFLNIYIYVSTEWVLAMNAKIYLSVNQHAKYVPHTPACSLSGFGSETLALKKFGIGPER